LIATRRYLDARTNLHFVSLSALVFRSDIQIDIFRFRSCMLHIYKSFLCINTVKYIRSLLSCRLTKFIMPYPAHLNLQQQLSHLKYGKLHRRQFQAPCTACVPLRPVHSHEYCHSHNFSARCLHNFCYKIIYTVRSKSFRTDFFFKSRRQMRKTHTFIYSKSAPLAYIYRLLRVRTVSEKLPQIPLFGPSSVTASWISATSAKWSPSNFIFNLENRK